MSKEYARVIHFAGERNDTNENAPFKFRSSKSYYSTNRILRNLLQKK